MKLKFQILTFLIYSLAVNFANAQESGDFVSNRKSHLTFNSSKKTNSNNNSKKSAFFNNHKFFEMQFKTTKKTKRFEIKNQTHNNIEIYSATIKTNFDDYGNPIIYNDNTINYSIIGKGDFPLVEAIVANSNIKTSEILESKEIYFPISENEIVPALAIYFEKDNETFLNIFNSDYYVIYNKSLSIDKNIVSKIANASVFNPDPITSAHTVYGGEYKHNSGATNPSLEAQQIDVSIVCNYDGTTYLLENDFCKIVDFALPNWNVVTSNDGNFDYTRNQIGFQQVNAFYHISEIKKYIDYLGFTDAVNYQINVDADGENGEDNSHFHPNGTKGKLEFGAYISGREEHVPDAEDAEVVVHEYTHAIINSYNTERNTNERRCLEEAMADYIAVSYARGIDDHNWQYVFKWDGHNEFWDGRMATSTKCYSGHYFGSDPYDYSDVWVAPLMDIYGELGKETTDKLVLHTITALDANTTMEQAALIMMSMDTVYNSNENSMVLFNAFKKYCILNDEHLANEDYEFSDLRVLNSQKFAAGGKMTIIFGKSFNGEITVYSITGKIILSKELQNKKSFSISSENLNSGIYLINIKNKNAIKTIKAYRY